MSKIIPILFKKFLQEQDLVADFFSKKFTNPLFYNSVDLRHSGFKIAPVDVNCFPAGFNNLNDDSQIVAIDAAKKFFTQQKITAKNILIISESHSRNLKYLTNVKILAKILSNIANVQIGSFNSEIDNQIQIDLENNETITLHQIVRNGNKIALRNGFEPNLIISNNDFTDGIPELLQNISQLIIPNPNLGWFKRLKSHHCKIYNEIVTEFCELINIDPWLISAYFGKCDNIDFKEKVGIECLAKNVDKIIDRMRIKYQEYGIKDDPYCFIKADNGTYGMAIMNARSGEEILQINKKERNKMNMLKGKVVNHNVIIQEGIPTIDKIKNITSEPMIYLLGGEVVGNLFRSNSLRDQNISLNHAGMEFYDLRNLTQQEIDLGLKKEEVIKVYEIVSRLSALAASLE